MRKLQRSPILDVGAAQGIIGHLVQDTGLTIDGVEANPQWAEMARPHYRQVWANLIEDAPLPAGTYRLIICGDVLEHVPSPMGVLSKLLDAATDDAMFIVSVPNVAHLSVRLMLLFGRFPKMERGILDRTHLHFFTRDTAQAMLRDAGLRVERITPTGVPLDEVWKTGEGTFLYRLLVKCQHAALAMMPRLFAMQWVMLASRGGSKPAEK